MYLIKAIGQLCNDVLIYYVKADPKQDEKHLEQNTVNAIVFKLQVIYSTVRMLRTAIFL